MLLDFRKPQVAIVEKFVSQTGKYLCFLGNHYHKGHTCWVFGSSNKVTGEIVMRHYSSATNSISPKAECETAWRKFKEGMLAKPKSDFEEDTHITRPWEKEQIRRGGSLAVALAKSKRDKPN
jgi:hypothetical protein